jgi:hypothetical protein
MQEIAPTKLRLTGNCPSDEELAAYIDGALDEGDAAQIAEHLVSCERCYEVYSETLRFQLDTEAATGAEVVPFPSYKQRRTAIARYCVSEALVEHELAPTKLRLTDNCSSDEELAAYIDGVLNKGEAAKVAEHLASCERCYEIYAETLRFQLDTAAAAPKVVPFPSYKERLPAAARYWLPIAALLLVGVGAGTAFHFLWPPPELVVAEVAPLPPNPAQTDQPMWLGPTYRGEGGEEDVKVDEASFRMGVQLVNLQLSLEANNADEARGDILPRIRQVLDTQTAVSSLVESFTALSAGLESKAPRELLGKAAQVTHDSRDYFDESYLDLGRWVEASRMAALARNPSFFQQADTRSFFRRFLWRDKLGIGDTKLDPVSRESLGQISEIVSKGDLQASDYTKLTTQLDKILEKYYPMM